MVFLFVIVLLAIFMYPRNPEGDVSNLLITIPILLVVMGLSVFNALRRQKRSLKSYKLIVMADSVTREIADTPTITMTREQIRSITKNSNGSITILGDSKLNVIGVPAQVNDIATAEQLLNQLRPMTIKAGPTFLQRYMWLVVFAIVGIIFLAFSSKNPYISTAGAITLAVLMLVSFVLIQKGKNYDKRLKRSSYFALVIAVMILAGVVMRILGGDL